MKRLLLTALIGFLVLGAASTAQAITLTPLSVGGLVSLSGTTTGPTSYGTLLTSLTQSFSATGYYTGTLKQWVYQNTDGLLFAYEMINNSSSSSALKRLSTNNFAGFTTSVDYYPAGSIAPYPYNGDRSNSFDNGRTVGFSFTPSGAVNPGTTSALLLIQTNASNYQWTTTAIQDGANVDVPTYGPSAVPEPGSMFLLGMGILGLFGLGKKKA